MIKINISNKDNNNVNNNLLKLENIYYLLDPKIKNKLIASKELSLVLNTSA